MRSYPEATLAFALSAIVAATPGCGSTSSSAVPPSSMQAANGTRAACDRPDLCEEGESGIYRAWLNYDRLGLTQVRFSISNPMSKHGSYVVVFPFPPHGRAHFFKYRYYLAKIDLTKYNAVNRHSYEVAGVANLRGDLGRFHFHGRLGKRFEVTYSDDRGTGTFSAMYVGPTHAPQTGALLGASPASTLPPYPTLTGTWFVTIGLIDNFNNYLWWYWSVQVTGTTNFHNAGGGGQSTGEDFSGTASASNIPYSNEGAYNTTVTGDYVANACVFNICVPYGDWQMNVQTNNGANYSNFSGEFGGDGWAPPQEGSNDGSASLAEHTVSGGVYRQWTSKHVTISVPTPTPPQ